jgi:hypothetical protein
MVSEFLSLLACLTLSVCASASLPSFSGSNIGSYAYIGCWAEPLSGAVRALVGAFYADDTMTLEQCSSNCAGAYQYWGVEYGREVSISPKLRLLSERRADSWISAIVATNYLLEHYLPRERIARFPVLLVLTRFVVPETDYLYTTQQLRSYLIFQ